MSEPVAAFLLSAKNLAGRGGVGVPVVGQDVVLSQLAGSHLSHYGLQCLAWPGPPDLVSPGTLHSPEVPGWSGGAAWSSRWSSWSPAGEAARGSS